MAKDEGAVPLIFALNLSLIKNALLTASNYAFLLIFHCLCLALHNNGLVLSSSMLPK